MVSPPRDEREQALRDVMQSLEHRKVETIAVTHRMALDALKAFQFALEDADGVIGRLKGDHSWALQKIPAIGFG